MFEYNSIPFSESAPSIEVRPSPEVATVDFDDEQAKNDNFL